MSASWRAITAGRHHQHINALFDGANMNTSHSTSDTNAFSDEGFWSTAKKYAKKIGREPLHKAFCLWLVTKDSNAPLWAKTTALGALGYLISPLDAIPDITPVIGFTDDIAVVAGAFIMLATYVTKEISVQAESMLPEWMQD
jgi:uncharacterized membrane protein YkvA (DUF1232 family)